MTGCSAHPAAIDAGLKSIIICPISGIGIIRCPFWLAGNLPARNGSLAQPVQARTGAPTEHK
jgi:hypothetical protein